MSREEVLSSLVPSGSLKIGPSVQVGLSTACAVPAVPRHRRSLSAITWALRVAAPDWPLVRHNVFFSPDYPAEFADLRAGHTPSAPSVYACALDRDAADGPPALGGNTRVGFLAKPFTARQLLTSVRAVLPVEFS